MSDHSTTRPRFGFALEYVADIDAAKRFYAGVLGLEVEREHPLFVQFRDPSGSHFAIASDEAMSANAELELYWLVDDVEAAYRELSGKATVSRPLEHLPFGTVFGIVDPTGQPRYLIELARDRPSQKVG
ncbi:MAG: VOC family protein [Chloroflexi bacterium]|nr:VOC family protein [Chloroflexota bacterium]